MFTNFSLDCPAVSPRFSHGEAQSWGLLKLQEPLVIPKLETYLMLSSSCVSVESWRDPAVELAYILFTYLRSNPLRLPEGVPKLFHEPEGSITMHAINLADLLTLVATLVYKYASLEKNDSYGVYIPRDYIFTPEALLPLRQVNSPSGSDCSVFALSMS